MTMVTTMMTMTILHDNDNDDDENGDDDDDAYMIMMMKMTMNDESTMNDFDDVVDQRAEQICIIYNLTCSWICWSIQILSIYLSTMT